MGRSGVRGRCPEGFTLIEMLVVITIIGILVGLLLPAVNMAREAGRRAYCSNNVKQIALAMLAHHTAKGCYPSGGWGSMWQGNPDRGFGREQPGSWAYSILPFIEADTVWKLGGDGRAFTNSFLKTGFSSSQKKDAANAAQTVLPLFNCPTRRRCDLNPCPALANSSSSVNMDPINNAFRGDYSASGGTNPQYKDSSGKLMRSPYDIGDHAVTWGAGPDVRAVVYASRWFDKSIANTSHDMDMDALGFNGICGQRTEIRQDDVIDGTGQTYLVGEKYVNARHYLTGQDGSDWYTALTGTDVDLVNWAGAILSKDMSDDDCKTKHLLRPPMQDRKLDSPTAPTDPANPPPHSWGSAHPSTFNVGMCDGSARQINYVIDPAVHDLLANRQDRQVIDVRLIGP